MEMYVFLFAESVGLQDVRIRAPKYVRRGEDVQLHCDYDIGQGNLYATKWYRNNMEFYRYLPKEIPSQQVFNQNETRVNVSLLPEIWDRL